MRWLLIASLSVNLLVIGAVAGAVFSGGPRSKGPPGERMISAPYVSAFSKTDRRALRDEMRKTLPKRRAALAANKADYSAFLEQLRAPVFDAAEARRVMEAQMRRASDVTTLGRKLAIERIAAMPDAERAAYADRLENKLERFEARFKRGE